MVKVFVKIHEIPSLVFDVFVQSLKGVVLVDKDQRTLRVDFLLVGVEYDSEMYSLPFCLHLYQVKEIIK